MRKPQMKKQEFKSLIDKAAKLCGSQNALARRLGVSQGSMSEYGSGKRSVPDEVIRRLAEISGENPADLWVMAQDARNPFRQEEEAEASINTSYQTIRVES
jgi:plasmid maintenance system antidote protein VapI